MQGAVFAVKVSNAETEMGVFAGEELVESWMAATRVPSTADELERMAASFMEARGIGGVDGAILCSVVPALTRSWIAALARLSDTRPLVVGPGLKSGIALDYKDPGQMGADRVAVCVAARELYGAPVIVADCGAAMSLSVVGREGSLLGGAIAPGVGMSLESLSSGAAQLAEVDLALPRRVIGRTTSDAVRTGIVLGEAARIDGLVSAMWAELGYETGLIATGQFAELVCAASTLPFTRRNDLALQGLRLIHARNT